MAHPLTTLAAEDLVDKVLNQHFLSCYLHR
jgi:hypothetical protein